MLVADLQPINELTEVNEILKYSMFDFAVGHSSASD